MKAKHLSILSIALLLTSTFAAVAGELNIVDPWVRSAPPNASALGVFVTLENHSNTDQSVVAVRSSFAAKRVEMHKTKMTGDVMRMMPQAEIPVAAHSTTVLKPGSWHIMLLDPEAIPALGDVLQITLVLDDGSEQSFDAVVRKGMKGLKAHKHNMTQE